jgi:hypothetical protein
LIFPPIPANLLKYVHHLSAQKEKKSADARIFEALAQAGRQECFKKKAKEGKEKD